MARRKTPSTPQAVTIKETKEGQDRTIEVRMKVPLEGSLLSDELAKTKKIPSLKERLEKAILSAIEEHQTAAIKYIEKLESNRI
jgi:hypothetical protein